jgi:serine/threonine-protein kinase
MTQGPVSGDAGSTRDVSSPRGDAALIGRTVSGKYRIEKFLGGGAMGAVYNARFAALEKNVALKVMHRSLAADPSFVERFHREAKAASRLDHPNSMRVIDFGEESDGLLYIAMEYVEGRDLYRVIHEDWPISNADIADIVMQALAAVAVAHEMGVIHRDLKPENLMILRAKDDEERDAYFVKVGDFGIAKLTEREGDPSPDGSAGQRLTTQGLVVGTPEYMSPEQARGEKLDARSDIYSIGIILYQLLTGRTPFHGDSPLAVVLKHISEPPPPPSVHYAGVHKGLEAVTLRAIAKDRNERFQSARAMRNAIREAIEERPAAAEAAAGEPDQRASGASASAGAVEVAPTIAGGMARSRLTPLGTAGGPEPRVKSRVGIVVGLVIVAVLAAAAAIVGPRMLRDVRRSGARWPLAPAAFDPGTCRAQLGAPRGAGSNVLSLNTTAGAWSACAQRAIHERPSAPIAANVHVVFSGSGAFRSASCAGCPPALAQCIASNTAQTMALESRRGAATGSPTFDVGATFTCD